MGLGAMLLLLILAVVFLPMLVRLIDRSESRIISGFQDAAPTASVSHEAVRVPPGATTSMASMYRPDSNTDYLCRSPHGSGQPCPEGTYCDGVTQSCVPIYVGGAVPDTGYFS